MSGQDPHPLRAMLEDAADGRFPPVDGVAEIYSTDAAGRSAVVEFTGHAVILTDRSEDGVRGHAPDGFGAATQPGLLLHLAGPGGAIGSLDAVLVRRGGGGTFGLEETDVFDQHPRVQRARHHRRDVRVFGDERGLVCVGTGLVGRTEISLELAGASAGVGAGRSLLGAVLDGLADDKWVFAQVAPGNAASLRMFLASGFVPIGSEILIEPL